MKILVMTDIHLDTNSMLSKIDLMPELVSAINSVEADILLITGDLSNSSRTSINILNKILESTDKKVLYVPGNHDVTAFDGSSWNSYNLLASHPTSLIDKPYIVNDDVVIIGDMGWYDYDFAPEVISKEIIKRRKKSLWDDALYVKWQKEDEEVFELIQNKLQTQIEKYKNKKIIFANHFIPYKDFVVYKSDGEWNLCNAFMGSSKLGQLLDRYSNISHVLFGHTHKRFGVIDDYKGKTIICNPVGYLYEWESDNPEQEFKKSMSIIEV